MPRSRILVVEDDAIAARDLQTTLESLGYDVPAWTGTGVEGLALARRLRPDLGVVDIGLPGDMDGVDLAVALRDELGIPVVFVTAHSDGVTVTRARDAGCYGFVAKPFSEQSLGIAISIAVERAGAERELSKRERHYRTLYRESVVGIVELAREGKILDANISFAASLGFDRPDEVRGLSLFDLFVSGEARRRFVTDLGSRGRLTDHEILLRRRDGSTVWMSCSAVLARIPPQETRTVVLASFFDLSRHKEHEDALRELAYRDPLTGLANRRLLELLGTQLVADAGRRGEWASFLYMDLVGFKDVNDRVGHAAGDRVLMELARRMESSRRAVDIVARLGGDEFGSLQGGASDAPGAMTAARRFLTSLGANYRVEGTDLEVGIRAGLAIFPDHARTLADLTAAADAALAEATRLGGSRLVIARPSAKNGNG